MTSRTALAVVFLTLCFVALANGQTTAFSYQGKLDVSGTAGNGNYDFEFRLYDTLNGGTQIGTAQTRINVPVAAGIFTVTLDFGGQFNGADRFLDISVRPNGGGAFTPLAPRKQILASPYSIQSLNTQMLGGIAGDQFVQTTDKRLSDARPPTPGSPDYIQNTTAQQKTSDFNISGTGTAGVLNAVSQFDLNGTRILASPGADNLFVGPLAGNNATGASNSFFGSAAGRDNSSGDNNSFFGKNAGRFNSTAVGNSFFGADAGTNTTTGGANSFFGREAGSNNSIGSSNSFFGRSAGVNNTSGIDNSFFGRDAGFSNLSERNSFFGRSSGLATNIGSDNSFFGYLAGGGNTTGQENTFLGAAAGLANTTGNSNTAIGRGANVGSAALTFATAVGAGAIVTQNSRIQLGRDGIDTVRVGLLASVAGVQLCHFGNILSQCSSSRRYKDNIAPFVGGLDMVKRLQPVTFDWKGRGEHDLGLIAEEVDLIEPLLVTRDRGQIEGVKYDQVSIVLINAVKEQQSQIESQQKLIDAQQKALEQEQAENAALRLRLEKIEELLKITKK